MDRDLRRGAVALLKRIDHAVGRRCGRMRVLVDARTPMNLAVLRPVWKRLLLDERLTVAFTAEEAAGVRDALAADGLADAFLSRTRAAWTRVDLAMTSDLWNHAPLRRCRRAMTFFHGVAGKYDLDRPERIAAADVARYDRIAFINADRMERYVRSGAVRPEQAALVGFPKLDPLVNGTWPASTVRASLGLPPSHPTVLYAPTFSPASSLHAAGTGIVDALLGRGYNVIVKLHDRSTRPDERTAGVDWIAALARFDRHPQFVLARGADAGPYLAAADLLVTDHSTVGFEFALLDRPIVVYDAPQLKDVARIADDKWNLLRSMADVVRTTGDLSRAVEAALRDPARLSGARHQAARLFAHPGRATAQALGVVYELLELLPPSSVERQIVRDADASDGSAAAHPVVDARVAGSPGSATAPGRHEAA